MDIYIVFEKILFWIILIIGILYTSYVVSYLLNSGIDLGKKIKALNLNEFFEEVKGFEKRSYHCPQEYKLKFPITTKCHCCKTKNRKHFIWYYDWKTVFICEKCGDRQNVSNLKKLELTHKKKLKNMLSLLIILVLLVAAYSYCKANTVEIMSFLDASIF